MLDCATADTFSHRYNTSGYTQSAAIFRGRLAAIRKQCGPSVSFTFVDPPHIVHSVNLPDGSLIQYDSTAGSATSPEEIPRAWFFAKDVVDPSGRSVKQYEGMDEAWAVLKSTLEETTYDAVLGFSQGVLAVLFNSEPASRHSHHCPDLHRLHLLPKGAAMAGALASRLASPDSGIDHPPFKLAVLVSGLWVQEKVSRAVLRISNLPD